MHQYKYIEKNFKNLNVNEKDILFKMSSDITKDGNYIVTEIILTKEKIYVIDKYVFSYCLKSIENVLIKELVTNCILYFNIDSKKRFISRFSNSKKTELFKLKQIILNIKKGKVSDSSIENSEQSVCPNCNLVYPDIKTKICPKCTNKKSVFLRLLSYSKKYKIKFILILLFMSFNSLLSTISPYISGELLFDEILNSNGKYYGKIIFGISLILAVYLLSLLSSLLYGRINAFVTANIIFDIKLQLFKSMQKLSIRFYQNKRTGTLLTNLTSDTNQVQEFFHDGFPALFINILTIFIVIITMLIKNPFLTFITLLPSPLILIISLKTFPKFYKKYTFFFKTRSTLNSVINDVLMGFRVVKSFGKENYEIKKFGIGSEKVKKAQVNLDNYVNIVSNSMNMLMSISIITVWAFGGWQVINNEIQFGTLITFTGYIALINAPLRFMTEIVDWWSLSMNSAVRIFNILDTKTDIIEIKKPFYIKRIIGNISFKEVYFSYENNKNILKDINFSIKSGEKVGLVGTSGAGKSTIANLILRLFDSKSGIIKIDNINIKNISLKSIQENIGIVMQETFLFNGSIYENISYAKPNASIEEVIKVAKTAGAHEFILKLPYGYDTVIGQNGYILSGGEKQRLSIARTILHDPQILIFDEATSSVDSKTEIQIQNALNLFTKDKTVILIAHRLSTLKNTDKIIVLEDGEIIETGTRENLLKNKSFFYKMQKKQIKALNIEGVI